MVDAFTMYVIYWNPKDHPDHWVTRRWYYGVAPHPDPKYRLAKTLHEARQSVPAGLYNIGRNPQDDPAVYEVWV